MFVGGLFILKFQQEKKLTGCVSIEKIVLGNFLKTNLVLLIIAIFKSCVLKLLLKNGLFKKCQV